MSEAADICENCGEWLLKGKCNFCYADIEEGQKFCSECGNPPKGITCPKCGKLSHFDFCVNCNTPLTEQAKETIELIDNSSDFNKIATKQIIKNQSFSLNDDSNIKVQDRILNIENSRQLATDAKQNETDTLKQLEETRSKTFTNNQQARKYFGALKVLLPKIVSTRNPVGWTCNAFGCTHPGGPQECADPSQGGTWTYDSITEYTFIETEI